MGVVSRILVPDPPRRIPGHRWIGIAFRTVHVLAFGILLGGHVFAVDPARLTPFLVASIVSGAAMMAVEIASTAAWLVMGKGLVVLAKLAVLATVLPFWDQRVAILVVVVVIASVGAHMPSRLRHASPISTMAFVRRS